MTRQDYEKKSFEELMEQLNEESDQITTYENLKEFAKYKIDENELNVARHILESIHNDSEEWYDYDYCMGTLDTPSSITCKEDVEHMIEED